MNIFPFNIPFGILCRRLFIWVVLLYGTLGRNLVCLIRLPLMKQTGYNNVDRIRVYTKKLKNANEETRKWEEGPRRSCSTGSVTLYGASTIPSVPQCPKIVEGIRCSSPIKLAARRAGSPTPKARRRPLAVSGYKTPASGHARAQLGSNG